MTIESQSPPQPQKPERTPSLIEVASQMVKDGYGVEDLVVRLKISRASAKAFVFGKMAQPRKDI